MHSFIMQNKQYHLQYLSKLSARSRSTTGGKTPPQSEEEESSDSGPSEHDHDNDSNDSAIPHHQSKVEYPDNG